jgi:hypothetical protein
MNKEGTQLLGKVGACPEARTWIKSAKIPDLQEAWQKCPRSDWMLWALNKINFRDDKTLRLYACACVRGTPLADGRTTWDLLTDPRSRTVVEVVERFAEGRATEEERDAARDAAWAAARAASDAAWAAARDAAWDAASDAAWDAASDAAWAAARAAAREAAREAARDAARAARDAAWDAARDAAWDAASDAAWDAARDAAWDAAKAAAWAAAWAWQADTLRPLIPWEMVEQAIEAYKAK